MILLVEVEFSIRFVKFGNEILCEVVSFGIKFVVVMLGIVLILSMVRCFELGLMFIILMCFILWYLSVCYVCSVSVLMWLVNVLFLM